MNISQLDLSRLQFATTTIYHFLFVPITIGLSLLVATLHTMWFRSSDPALRRLTRFFGNLLVINIAIGVVTGLVQEFEFGMNWSQYSRFVGDVFGAPLAMEGLAAFFLESTFLGLWLFGWGILPKKLHLASIWAVAVGATMSAGFIMAANSWMQHPVGYQISASTGGPQLTSISALFTNPVFVWGYLHVILASLMTGALLMLSVSGWHLRKKSSTALFVRTAKLALAFLVPVSIAVLIVGSYLGVIETTSQPMKVAAMEAQWETCAPCSFSAAQIGGWTSSTERPTKIIEIPHLLSVLATGSSSPARVRADVPVGVHVGRHRALRDEHRGMAADRERPPALGGPGPAADQERQLALGQPHRGRDQPGSLLGPLPRAGHRLGVPHDAVRTSRP